MATDTVTSSSLLGNVTRYEDVKDKTASKTSEDMGKQDFLTLFTAQLQNQNPLEPVKNEAFVAQLAQFSQLEALTNMQTSLDTFVSAMSGERMLNSASLIGKKSGHDRHPHLVDVRHKHGWQPRFALGRQWHPSQCPRQPRPIGARVDRRSSIARHHAHHLERQRCR